MRSEDGTLQKSGSSGFRHRSQAMVPLPGSLSNCDGCAPVGSGDHWNACFFREACRTAMDAHLSVPATIVPYSFLPGKSGMQRKDHSRRPAHGARALSFDSSRSTSEKERRHGVNTGSRAMRMNAFSPETPSIRDSQAFDPPTIATRGTGPTVHPNLHDSLRSRQRRRRDYGAGEAMPPCRLGSLCRQVHAASTRNEQREEPGFHAGAACGIDRRTPAACRRAAGGKPPPGPTGGAAIRQETRVIVRPMTMPAAYLPNAGSPPWSALRALSRGHWRIPRPVHQE